MEAKSESPSAAILKLEGLNLHYADKHVLKNINMDIQPHSITALIGPSGCGKSSLLRCLNRMNDLIETTAIDGKIMYSGTIDINSRKLDVTQLRRKIGMVFQKPNPFPKTIYENIAYGVRIASRVSKSELDEGGLKRR